ncbi:hypothetical protein [Sphingomonas sp. 10B4]|nr:hypothetical protein [Sphingomonas sp. 10B4]MDY7525303.1 hypothetical protein [Sphingomonas sp. 10B4]MEB0283157.1 hypothetical protein [Sphingomonas sp. 10B4]
MGYWLYEANEQAAEIARIESLFESLAALRGREEHLRHVLECADVVMKEINPSWTMDDLKPVQKHVRKAPGRSGEIARLTLDILREAQPLTAREIAVRAIKRLGQEDADKETVERVYKAVEATLRAKLKSGLVQNDGNYGRKWKIAV